jgi:hypothetical protein
MYSERQFLIKSARILIGWSATLTLPDYGRVARHPTATLNPRTTDRYLVQEVDSLTQTVRDDAGRELACQTQRAAAAPLSSGRVLKAMAACGAARRMALTTASNRISRLSGRRRPAPITTQS